ncbi:uncharacterized protein LOC141854871 [Brevipalpus obovatus]|uniref:uncharacterized protein LOC141854871 n=1 Tax=Brevipalpus obovatus TaxID=246614 RepID=UPI003D9EE4D2
MMIRKFSVIVVLFLTGIAAIECGRRPPHHIHHRPHHHQVHEVQVAEDVEVVDPDERPREEDIELVDDRARTTRRSRLVDDNPLQLSRLVHVNTHRDRHGEHEEEHIDRVQRLTTAPRRPQRPKRLGYGHRIPQDPMIPIRPDLQPVPVIPPMMNIDDFAGDMNEREMLEVVNSAGMSAEIQAQPLLRAFINNPELMGDGVMIGNKIYTSDPLLLAALRSQLSQPLVDGGHHQHHHHHHPKHHGHRLLAHDHHLTQPRFIVAPKLVTSLEAVPLIAPASVIALDSKRQAKIVQPQRSG